MAHVALSDNVHKLAEAAFIKAGYDVSRFEKTLTEDELLRQIGDAEIIGLRTNPNITDKLVTETGGLAVVACYSSGYDHITGMDAATELGIPVFNSQDNALPVAEQTMTMAGNLARRYFVHSDAMQSHRWSKTEEGARELSGMTIGVVGLGEIGSLVAEEARNRGMDVVFFDPYKSFRNDEEREETEKKFKRAESLEELIKSADIVSLHSRPSEDGRPTMGAEEFAWMKEGSYFINTARAELMELDALVEAIDTGKLAGVHVDVYEEDPKQGGRIDSVLIGRLHQNVVVTPHLGGATPQAQERTGTNTTKRVLNYLREGTVIGSVNFPSVELATPLISGRQRLRWAHSNQAGVLNIITSALAEEGINIEDSELGTRGELGYALVEVKGAFPRSLVEMIAGHEYTLRAAVLSG